MKHEAIIIRVLGLVLACTAGVRAESPARPPAEQDAYILGQRRTSPAPPPSNELDLRQAFAPIAVDKHRSVVGIIVAGQQVALGTVVSPEGHIITKASELRGPAAVRMGGRHIPAKLIGIATEHDLAMLKIDASNLRPLTFDDVQDPGVGKWLAAVGPAELPIAVGIVSVERRTILADVVMGVFLGESTDPGARVVDVNVGGGADRAGMQVDDLIIAIDKEPIADQLSLHARLTRMKPGQKINVCVLRDGQQVDLEIVLGARPQPSERSRRQNSMGGKLSGRRAGFPAVIQHDMVNLSPSECGSPVITLDGKVVGLNIARAGRTETYALPSSVLLGLIEDLKSGKYSPDADPLAANPPSDRRSNPQP